METCLFFKLPSHSNIHKVYINHWIRLFVYCEPSHTFIFPIYKGEISPRPRLVTLKNCRLSRGKWLTKGTEGRCQLHSYELLMHIFANGETEQWSSLIRFRPLSSTKVRVPAGIHLLVSNVCGQSVGRSVSRLADCRLIHPFSTCVCLAACAHTHCPE